MRTGIARRIGWLIGKTAIFNPAIGDTVVQHPRIQTEVFAVSAPILLDFQDQPSAERALKKAAQFIQRAGQPVISTSYDPKLRRDSGVTYREASLGFAGGQAATLRVTQAGDIFQVLLNGVVVPITATDPIMIFGEIAKLSEDGQEAFQKSNERVPVELPDWVTTTAPRLEAALQAQLVELDGRIADRQAQIAALTAELAEPVLDNAGQPRDERGRFDSPGGGGGDGGNGGGGGGGGNGGGDNGGGGGGGGGPGNDEDFERKMREMREKNEDGEGKAADAAKEVASNVADTDPTLAAAKEVAGAAAAVGKALKILDSVDDVASVADAVGIAQRVSGGEVLDSATTSAAVATLQNALLIVETNSVINMGEGNLEQAELERSNAESFRAALAILDAAETPSEGPEIPEPEEPVPSTAAEPAMEAVDKLIAEGEKQDDPSVTA